MSIISNDIAYLQGRRCIHNDLDVRNARQRVSACVDVHDLDGNVWYRCPNSSNALRDCFICWPVLRIPILEQGRRRMESLNARDVMRVPDLKVLFGEGDAVYRRHQKKMKRRE